MRHYLERDRGGREAAREWNGREGGRRQRRARRRQHLGVARGRGAEVVHRIKADRGRAARGRYLPGTAAPPIRTRHCRAKIGGTSDPATSAAMARGSATSSSRYATMHGAAQAFHRAMVIGVAKNVSFGRKKTVLDLKLVYKKC